MAGNYIGKKKNKKKIFDIIQGFGQSDFFDKLDTVEKEKAFIKLFVSIAKFTFKRDYVGAQLDNTCMSRTFGEWTEKIFCENVGVYKPGMQYQRNVKISWPLFAQWVQTCRYDYPNKYKKYADKIHRKYNINKFLQEAEKASKKSKCHKMHVGSVLVIDGQIKAKGYNFHPAKTRRDDVCLRMETPHATDISFGYCIHAEQNMVIRCNPRQLSKGIIYVTHPPCPMCMRLLIQAKTPLVVYKIGDYPETGPDICWDLGGNTRIYGV
jgi:dCMP deaminase